MKQFCPENRLFCFTLKLQNSRFSGILVCAPFCRTWWLFDVFCRSREPFLYGIAHQLDIRFLLREVTTDGYRSSIATLKILNFYGSLPSLSFLRIPP